MRYVGVHSRPRSLARVLALPLACLLLLSRPHGDRHAMSAAEATAAAAAPTFLHDRARTNDNTSETTLSPSNARRLTKLWSLKTPATIEASAIVSDGTVFIGSWDGYEYALHQATGQVQWKTYLGRTTTPPGNGICNPPFSNTAGITSSPTIQHGVVYLSGGDSNFYALSTATGRILWKLFINDTGSGYYNYSSPVLANGFAYIGLSSYGNCPSTQGAVLQIDLSAHRVVHRFNVVPFGAGGSIWSSPAYDAATNTVYITTGEENAIGAKSWIEGHLAALIAGAAAFALLALLALSWVLGFWIAALRWTHRLGGTSVRNGPIARAARNRWVLIGGALVVAAALAGASRALVLRAVNAGQYTDSILALDARDLTLEHAWSIPRDKSYFDDADFGAGPVLFTDSRGRALVGAVNKNGYFYALERSTFRLVWAFQVGDEPGDAPPYGNGSISPAAFAAGVLYVAGGHTTIDGRSCMGSLRALNATTGKPLWQDCESGVVLGAVAYAHGLVVIGAGNTLKVYEARHGALLYAYQESASRDVFLSASPSIANGQILEGSSDGILLSFGLGKAGSRRTG